MKTKMIKLCAMVVAVSLIAGPVFAWGGDKGKCGEDKKGKEKCEQMKRDLGLTPEQDKLLTDARQAHRQEMEETLKALKDKRAVLKVELGKPGATAAQVAPMVAEIKKILSDIVDSRVEGILKVKSILTPEQYDKLESMKDKKHDKGRSKR